MKRLVYIVLASLLAACFQTLLPGCSQNKGVSDTNRNSAHNFDIPETLRVATIYGPLSFFYFRDDTMGYDFSLVKEFSDSKNVTLEFTIVPGTDSAIRLLQTDKVDLIAYGIPVTDQFADILQYCGPIIETTQVLVQRINDSVPLITDVTKLIGHKITVPENSKYQQRIQNLNRELGGGINIETVKNDSLTDEDIIALVAEGKIHMGIVNSDIAALNKTYYPNIDVSLQISFPQQAAWAVDPTRTWLADSVDSWFKSEGTQRQNETILKRYFELSKSSHANTLNLTLAKGYVSDYDSLFMTYARDINWDWRLLAAMAYVESAFNSDLVSWAGARGIMQIMPSTAKAWGYNTAQLADPETSIAVAAKIIQSTDKSLARYIADPQQRQTFIVAAYNSGIAHIIDAVALAKKHGRQYDVWFGNVEEALLLKADPAYYNDPVVKYGYFRGRQTTRYVRDVYNVYDRIKKQNIK